MLDTLLIQQKARFKNRHIMALSLCLLTACFFRTNQALSKPTQEPAPSQLDPRPISPPSSVLPPAQEQSLGDDWFYPVRPGTIIKIFTDLEVPSDANQPNVKQSVDSEIEPLRWKIVDGILLRQGNSLRWMIILVLPTEGSVLVFLAPEKEGYRVVGTYANSFGGLGSEMKIVATTPFTLDENKSRLKPDEAHLMLVEVRETYRGSCADATCKRRIPPLPVTSWVTLGLSSQGIWLAADRNLMGEPDQVYLKRVNGTTWLITCTAKEKRKTHGKRGNSYALDKVSLRFHRQHNPKLSCPL